MIRRGTARTSHFTAALAAAPAVHYREGVGDGASRGDGGAHWPRHLWLVRHGESAGNVASRAADEAGLCTIDIAVRDMDVPLSPLGERQARALGQFFRDLSPDERPTAVLASTYARARTTAEIALASAGLALRVQVDERLREREFGIIDCLTKRGILERFPDQAALRARIGKFYYRPPGGESWCDVILRLRNVVDSLTRDYSKDRVLVISHQVVVLGFRYLIERMTEEEILAIDRAEEIANCSVTSYALDPSRGGRGAVKLQLFNHVAPVAEAGEIVTREADAPVAPK